MTQPLKQHKVSFLLEVNMHLAGDHQLERVHTIHCDYMCQGNLNISIKKEFIFFFESRIMKEIFQNLILV